jgi:hypothetical protein
MVDKNVGQRAWNVGLGVRFQKSPARNALAARGGPSRQLSVLVTHHGPATPLLGLRWTFRAKRACVVITDAEPDRGAREARSANSEMSPQVIPLKARADSAMRAEFWPQRQFAV